MKNAAYRHIRIMEGGAELHTRKGWRGLSRPAGTNRRRKLTRLGLTVAPLSRAYRLKEMATQPGHVWGRVKEAFRVWVVDKKAERALMAVKAEVEARALAKQQTGEGKVARVER
jgi:hypothetical protein